MSFVKSRNHKTAKWIIVVLLFSFSLPENALDRLVIGFKKYLEQLPQEKVYIHMDRPYYTSGETIWFKAYTTAGPFHEPSPYSHTIYVELIDPGGKLVNQVILFTETGSAGGNMILTDSLPSGNYLIRGYTHWMKNVDEDYFFHRPVKIWNQGEPVSAGTNQGATVDLQFFPEGGYMVTGILSKVAFKAVGTDGLGKEIKGRIIDDAGNRVCNFKSNVLGMGAFPIIPQMGKSYKAVFETPQQEVQLPPSKDTGVVMSVQNSSKMSDIILRILTSDFNNYKTVYILAQTRGVVCYAARMDMSKNSVAVKIPKAAFPGGVSQITVTDINGIPLVERLAFVNEPEELSVKITTNKMTYAPRELVKLSVQAFDTIGRPALADFSLSVVDDQQVLSDNNREAINSYLYLSSELKGHIESPGYYFNAANLDRKEALDYLLMTQGWRRLSFEKAMEPQWGRPQYLVEQGLTFKGKLVDKYNNKPIPEGKVSYLATDPEPDLKVVTTNTSGDFEINHVIYYYPTTQAVLSGETKKGNKAIKILLDQGPDFPATQYPRLPLEGTQNDFERAFIARSIERKNIDRAYKSDDNILLNEIQVRAKREEPVDNPKRVYGLGSVSKRVADDPYLENMVHPLQLIQGRVAGVQVSGAGWNWNVTIRGVGSILSGTTPLIMIDDLPVDIDALNMLPVRDIESYEIWKGPDAVIFGSRGANGAIGFYTRRGQNYIPPKEGVFPVSKRGFQIEREFYAPKYDIPKPEHVKPDKRVTLFWAPHVKTDSTGRATVMFYNGDDETSVSAFLEGLSTAGKPGVAVCKYRIERK